MILAGLAHSAVSGEAVQLEGRKLTDQAAGARSIKVSEIAAGWILPSGHVEVKGKTGSLYISSEPYVFMKGRNVVACVAKKRDQRSCYSPSAMGGNARLPTTRHRSHNDEDRDRDLV
ncbi:hypothetical protein [Xanthomonas axonopodis]|uniref:hypothetical protein n=1 Tax=Xanthomonas axonopodis TaxID=53413 RepID=UPI003556E156